MSLLGNRGRFSSDENNSINLNSENISELSSIGKNPKSFLHLKNSDNAKKETEDDNSKKKDIRERIIDSNLKNFNNRSEHQNYNNTVSKRDSKINDTLIKNTKLKSASKAEKTKIGIKTIVAMIVVEILTLASVFNFAPFIRATKLTQVIPFDVTNVTSPYIDENTINIMKGYKTVVVFGVDSRNGSVAKGANADVNIIVNLNVETGDVQLVSLYRDLYLSVTDNNTYDKLNSAYRRNGPEGAVKTINKNLDLNIVNFFAFNWKAVADGISLLGGVDLEITSAEYKYMNAFIHETCIATGIDAKNPAAHYIKSTGMQHLDGVQAVAYGRLRLMDSDFQRVDRQKKVIALCLEKAKKLDLATLRLIIESILPQIAYEFDFNEMVSLLRLVNNITIVESTACPELSNLMSMEMGSAGSCVVPISLEKAVTKLHSVLFNEEDYNPSDAVKRYSNRIIELRRKHQEENALKEQEKKESEEAASSTNSTTVARSNNNKLSQVSTSSNTSKTRATSSTVPILPDEGNEEETTVEVVVGVSPNGERNTETDTRESESETQTEQVEGVVVGVSPGERINNMPSTNGTQGSGVESGGPTQVSETIVEPQIVIP